MIRAAYAIMTDQPTLGLVTGLAAIRLTRSRFPTRRPPGSFCDPWQRVQLGRRHCRAGVGRAQLPGRLRFGMELQYPAAVRQGLRSSTASYFGSKGTDLNIERNYNQLVNGARPYPSAVDQQPHRSRAAARQHPRLRERRQFHLQGLWVTVKKRLRQGPAVRRFLRLVEIHRRQLPQRPGAGDSGQQQHRRRPRPFRFRRPPSLRRERHLRAAVQRTTSPEGWQISLIETLQTGNPLNFHQQHRRSPAPRRCVPMSPET